MKEIRISFVLASFNGALYIEAQVRSILAALGPDDEVVVSDDGSTDQTLEILRAIGDDRVQLTPPGRRLGYQRNFQRAIEASRGSYIFFSDQDDICLPRRVPKSLDALSHCDCVCGDAIVVDQDLNEIASSFFALRKARFGAVRLFCKPAVIGATMACRREFVIANLPFPRDVPHDMWLSILAALQGRLSTEPGPFILYRRHEYALSDTATKTRRNLSRILAERIRLLVALVMQRLREGGQQ
jgi:glycosyltransferase involved in cell wall biosynthesis